MDTLKTAVTHIVLLATSDGMLTYHFDLHKQLLLVRKKAQLLEPTFPYKATGLPVPMGPRKRPGGDHEYPSLCSTPGGKKNKPR